MNYFKFCLFFVFFVVCMHSAHAMDPNQYRHYVSSVEVFNKPDNKVKFTQVVLNDGSEWYLSKDDKDFGQNPFRENLEIFIKSLKHAQNLYQREYLFCYSDEQGNPKETTVWLSPSSGKNILPYIVEFKAVLKGGWIFKDYDYFLVLSDGSSWKIPDASAVHNWVEGDIVVISPKDSNYEKWFIINASRLDCSSIPRFNGTGYTFWRPFFEVDVSDIQ